MIAPALLAEIYAHAREAFPRECCGYIAGERVVRCTNVAAGDDEYEIGGAELFAFARSFDSAEPARIVYHSHPNGRAYFSARDRAAAGGYAVDYLVVGITAEAVTEAALFNARGDELARMLG